MNHHVNKQSTHDLMLASFITTGDDKNAEDQVDRQTRGRVGARYKSMGFRPHHPVALFNSLSGCVIEVVKSERLPQWEAVQVQRDGTTKDGGALWVDISKVTAATLGNVTGIGHTNTAKERDRKWRETLLQMLDSNQDGDVDTSEILAFLKNNAMLRDDTLVRRVCAEAENKTPMELMKELKAITPKLLSALLHTQQEATQKDPNVTNTSVYYNNETRKYEKEQEVEVELDPNANPNDNNPNDNNNYPEDTGGVTRTTVNKNAFEFIVDHMGSTEFTKHMQLMDGWKDPPGIQVRARKGIAAMECLVANDPMGLAAKLGAALMLPVTSALKDCGYEEGPNLRGYGYDWRMPCTKMEERDSYFSNTMMDMEDLVQKNDGRKIVVISHSLGGVTASYFFQWVAHSPFGINRGGVRWLENHIHAFLPIGGPLLGTPFGSASYLSGDEGQGLAPMVFSYADRHLVVRSWGMFGMIFPTGRHLMLQPTKSVHWVRREGVLYVHIVSVSMSSDNPTFEQNYLEASKQFYVRAGFRLPQKMFKKKLTCTPTKMSTCGAIDEYMQFCWTENHDSIDDAVLTLKLYRDWVGPIDKVMAKGTFRLGTDHVRCERGPNEGQILEGLKPREWVPYVFDLKENKADMLHVSITVNLLFTPFADNEFAYDFRRPDAEHPGAFRCGGKADACTSPEKQARLKQALGDVMGTEWTPEPKGDVQHALHSEAKFAPMSIDQMMVIDQMEENYNMWKSCYYDDDIWRQYSTEPPQGVHRIRPIYGINVPTLIGNVYRRVTKRFVRFQPTTTLKLDKHCQVEHPGYDCKGGIVTEVPHKTPQADDPNLSMEQRTFNTRASGDGTVAYWSLRWPVTWRNQGYNVEAIEVEGAGHRDILERPQCIEAVLGECCSHPIQYVELWIDYLTYSAGKASCGRCCCRCLLCPLYPLLCPLALVCTCFGFVQNRVFLQLGWEDDNTFTTETVAKPWCGQRRPVKRFQRFVFGVTQKDLDDDRVMEVTLRTAVHAHASAGPIAKDTEARKLPISHFAKKNQEDTETCTFDDGIGHKSVGWHWRWYEADNAGKPNFDRPIQK